MPFSTLHCGCGPLIPAAGVLALLSIAAGLPADDPGRPSAAGRLVKQWDFEDAASQVEPVPPGWFRAQHDAANRPRPGFPAWNAARTIGDPPGRTGNAVMLPTRGGSASLLLAGGVIAVLPDVDYAVSALIRTQGLTQARARMSAWLLDETQRLIEGTRTEGPLVLANDAWETVWLDVRGHKRAVWLQIELQLLQPRDSGARHLGRQEVWPEDFGGAAWFDDVAVFQVPRVELRTTSETNVFIEPQSPHILAGVRDLTGEPLAIELALYDAEGRRLHHQETTNIIGGRRLTWTPTLTRFGWYRATMTLLARDRVVGRRSVDLVFAPQGHTLEPAMRRGFGLVAEGLRPEQRALLPVIAAQSAAGRVAVPVWDRALEAPHADEWFDRLAPVLESLIDSGREVTLILEDAPAALASERRIDITDPLPLLLADDDPWLPFLARPLARFGERVRWWQVGSSTAPALIGRPEFENEMEQAYAKLRRLAPRPSLALPLTMEQPLAPLGPVDMVTILWPLSMPSATIAQAAADWPASVQKQVLIETPNSETFGRRGAALELARRASCAWAAGVTGIAIRNPWRFVGAGEPECMPGVEIGVWRVLGEMLAQRRCIGELEAGPGGRVFIGAGRDAGLLVGWSDSPDASLAVIRGYFGEGPLVAVDPFGNRTPIPALPEGGHEMVLTDMPVFVEGIDAPLARFRSALHLEPDFVPARAQRHRLELVVENPWGTALSGRIRLGGPTAWEIAPRVVNLNVPAGTTARIPLELWFNPGEESGRRVMVAEAELLAERRYPVQHLPLALEVGLPSVDLRTGYRVERAESGSGDVVVSLLITNVSDQPLTMEAFAVAPGFKVYSAPVSRLPPGNTVTRRFRFEGGAQSLKGKGVRVGVKELDGTGRVNRTLEIR